jgi:hypothetical protein
MNVFLYQAELFCQPCGESLRESIPVPAGADLADESTFDSDAYPKGPYPDGGGLADSPQHCGDCHTFLENPLTEEGESYVRRKLTEHACTGAGRDIVLKQWAEFYSLSDNFAEEEDVEPLEATEAASYAAQWGSYMTSSDPGAYMYSFDLRGNLPDNRHRDMVLRHIRSHCYPIADSGMNADLEEEQDEPDSVMLRRLAAYVKTLDYPEAGSCSTS